MNCFIIIIMTIFITACQTNIQNINQQKIAKDNVELGMAYWQHHDNYHAKKKFLLALQQTPDWPVALEAMAYFLEKTGDVASAIKFYQKAVKIAPRQGKILNNYAVFLCRQNQTDKAIQLFLQATKDPNYLNAAKAYQNAGLCALHAKQKQLAIALFQQAVQADPDQVLSLKLLLKLQKR